jgi:type IV pilus assembly protein PilC
VWATDRSAARAALRAQRCHPIQIEEESRAIGKGAYRTRLKTEEVIAIIDQLEMQLEADIPIDEALRNLARDLPDGRSRFVVSKILEQIAINGRVSDAFAQFPKIFAPHLVKMIDVGHQTGRLGPTLGKIVAHLHAVDEIRAVVKKALSYPLMAFVVTASVAIFLMGFVMPMFGRVFHELGVKLPALTRFYLDTGAFVGGHLAAVIIAAVFLPFLVWLLFRQSSTKRVLDQAWARLPVLKDIVQCVVIARLAGNLGALYDAEIPIQEGIRICSRITGNIVYDRAVQQTLDRIGMGQGVGEALESTRRFPGIMTLSLKVGENTGKLSDALDKVNRYYARRSREKIGAALQFIEPLMTVAMGAFVGSVAVSLFLPLVRLAMSIKQ